ncbi:MAG: shikimate dehydrogenase [Solirubrobacterales bacterium]
MPKLAVVGQPVAHSRSPAMQTAALAELGLAGEWSYEAIEVSPEDFLGRVRALPRQGFAGVNVTVPHKVAALAVATGASPSATSIGAANTLTFAGGAIAAENTDATGIIAALGPLPAGRRALVLGAGGAARAAVWALVDGGADVSVWNRTPERAGLLARELGAGVLELAGREELPLEEFDLLVNATTVGLGPANSAPGGDLGADPDRGPPDLKALHIGADALKATHEVVDLVYGAAETPLAAAARARGAKVVDGLEVLVHQGAASLRIWTGMEPPIETMRRAAHAL